MYTPNAAPWGNLKLSTPKQEGLHNLFVGCATEVPLLKEDALISAIREDISIMEFVHPDIVCNYEIYKKVRKFLNDRLVETPQNLQSGVSIARRVICAIWSGDSLQEDRRRALGVFDAVKRGEWHPASPSSGSNHPLSPFPLSIPGTPRGAEPSPSVPATRNPASGYSTRNAPTAILSNAYRYEKQKFTGDGEQDWSTKLARYNLLCIDNNIRAADKVRHLHHLLEDGALQFYINEIEGKCENWGAVVQLFNNRYSSATRKERMSNRLQALSISGFEKAGCTETEALRKVVQEIDRLAPMSHTECQTDRAKRMFLQTAVKGRNWAFIVLSNSYGPSLKYKELVDQLENAQQQSVVHAISGENTTPPEFRQSRWRTPVNTNYAGQGRYARTPTSSRSIVPRSGVHTRSPPPGTFGDIALQRKFNAPYSSPKVGTCHNCGLPDCRWFRCKQPLDMERVMENRRKARSHKNSTGSARVNTADIVHELSSELSEALLLSDATHYCSDNDEDPAPDVANTKSKLHEDLKEASFQHAHCSVSFDADDPVYDDDYESDF